MLGFFPLGRSDLGQAGNAEYYLPADVGLFELDGGSVRLIGVHAPLAAGNGVFSLSGQSALLEHGRTLPAAYGSLSISGQAVLFHRSYAVQAALGVYAFSGQAASKIRHYIFPASQGAFSITGRDAVLKEGHLLAAANGAFVITGEAARLLHGYNVLSEVGHVTIDGEDVGYTWLHSLAADFGVFSYTGDVGPGTNLKRYRPHARPTPYATGTMKASPVGGRTFSAMAKIVGQFRPKVVSGD